MPSPASTNKTLNFLSSLMSTYNIHDHSSQVPDHIHTIFNILSSSGSNLSGSSITTGLLRGGEDDAGDGGDYADNFARFLDADTVAFYYDEADLEQLRKPWVKVTYFIPLVLVYALIFVTGITGNSLVVAVLSFGRAGRCVTFPCLISMAWADNLFLLVCVPYAVVNHFFSHWSLTRFLCKLSGFVEHLTANATVLSLILISVERYLVIAHPISAKRYCTSKTTRIALLCTWLAAFLMACPAFAVMGTESSTFYNNSSSVVVVMCADLGVSHDGRVAYALWKLASLFIVPTAILVFCYVKCIHVLWSSTRQLETMTSNNMNRSPFRGGYESSQVELTAYGNSSHATATILRSSPSLRAGEKALQARKQVIKMLIIIIVVFFVAWGPKLVLAVLKKYQVSFLYFPSAFVIERIFNILPYVQSSINPIIYVFMSRNIRSSIQHAACLLCACKSCRNRHRVDESPSHELLPTKHTQVEVDSSTTNNRSHFGSGTRAIRAHV
ncbi:orphan G-protein coupled receptor 23 [Elysia marginata]|uniref:Orphan G-protein coupled receptor 23 n=1 Tax=Elysia marginata TaxID=1093978 RepID=A0AAV4HZ14_9GAST|nr:orphan G-protein coupled receptor 23 [Elysia marginata]